MLELVFWPGLPGWYRLALALRVEHSLLTRLVRLLEQRAVMTPMNSRLESLLAVLVGMGRLWAVGEDLLVLRMRPGELLLPFGQP